MKAMSCFFMTVVTVLVFLSGTWVLCTENKSLHATCVSKPVEEGHTGVIDINLMSLANLTGRCDLLYLKKNGSNADVLLCDGLDKGQKLQCNTTDGRFETEGLHDHRLVLRLPNATRDLQGIYVFNCIGSRSNTLTNCNVTVLPKAGLNASAVGVTQNGSGEVPVYVPIIVVITVVIVAIVVVIVFLKRRQKLGCFQRKHREGKRSIDKDLAKTSNTETEDEEHPLRKPSSPTECSSTEQEHAHHQSPVNGTVQEADDSDSKMKRKPKLIRQRNVVEGE